MSRLNLASKHRDWLLAKTQRVERGEI
jgi:hypothetical protein